MDPRLESALEIVQRMDGFLAAVLYTMDSIDVIEGLEAPALTDYRTISVASTTLAWPTEDLAFVLAHEACHVICRHDMRRGDREVFRWNIACDKVINRAITTTFSFSKPESIPIALSLDSEEELYEVEKGRSAYLCCTPASNNVMTRAVARRVEEIVRAARHGAGVGLLEHLSPEDARLPLPLLLASILARGRDEYSFRRPSHASRACGVYLPSLSARTLCGTVMLSIDTSGSMSDADVARGVGGIISESRRARMARLVVVQQDTEATVVYDGPPAGYHHAKMRRNGGTNFRPLMDLARKLRPRLLAAITDLDGQHGTAPGCRVVWITSSSSYPQPPFGLVCHF